MTTPLAPDSLPARTLRRVVVESLSNTVANRYIVDPEYLARAMLARSLGDDGSLIQHHLTDEAGHLASAYIALISANPLPTMIGLINEALALHKAHTAAAKAFLVTWGTSGLEPLTVMENFIAGPEDPTIAAYAKAAGTPYALTCKRLYEEVGLLSTEPTQE